VFELNGMFRPARALPLLLPQMKQPPRYAQTRTWLEDNDGFRRDILKRLLESGPLLSGEIPDTSQVSWPSTGWTNDRNVTQMLEILAMRGQVAIAGREKRQRYWDLPERVYPRNLPELSLEEARRERDARRLRALGIARAKSTGMPDEPIDVGETGVDVVVEGVKGAWRVDPDALTQLAEPFEGRTALLSPFDRLVFDRKRLLELFDYEYILEMYKPKATRRWGYFALPILHGDEFVGKLDAATDRKAEVLRVTAIHEDIPFTPDVAAAVDEEIDQLASWLGVRVEGA
ncbi:MAG TPA: crosslink repair DNA glycosylase YcaQ family protein, partial [Microbacterium sp.]|nr:crosslink repair DNA glycosylase YcaQ family protein [Microbacterium sp.]